MTIVDHLFVFLLFVVQPVHGALSYRRYLGRIEAGQPTDRMSLYRWTGITQWLALATLMATWYWLDRPYSDLGFIQTGGTAFYVGVAVLIGVSCFLLYSWYRSKAMTIDEKSKQAQALGNLVHFLPCTIEHLRAFLKLSVTAGIVEEIIYRGFVIWYLALVMPIWGAVVVSSVLFGIGHSYQGVSGAIKTGLVGLSFGTLYVLTGSIWLPILGHVLLDALQGFTILEILRPTNLAADHGDKSLIADTVEVHPKNQ